MTISEKEIKKHLANYGYAFTYHAIFVHRAQALWFILLTHSKFIICVFVDCGKCENFHQIPQHDLYSMTYKCNLNVKHSPIRFRVYQVFNTDWVWLQRSYAIIHTTCKRRFVIKSKLYICHKYVIPCCSHRVFFVKWELVYCLANGNSRFSDFRAKKIKFQLAKFVVWIHAFHSQWIHRYRVELNTDGVAVCHAHAHTQSFRQ